MQTVSEYKRMKAFENRELSGWKLAGEIIGGIVFFALLWGFVWLCCVATDYNWA